MRLSTSTNIVNFHMRLPYMAPFEHAVSVCAAAGYRYVDANLCGMCRKGKRFAPMTEDRWEQSVHAWRKLADDIGVTFSQAHAYFSADGPIAPDGVPGGAFGEEMMRRSVLAAEILGSEWMVVHPVNVVEGDCVLVEETYRYNLEYFRRWHEVFHDHGVGMAIENMTNHPKSPSPFADIATLNRLIDELDAPDIGACLDTGHAFLSGYDPVDCVRQLGHRLKATHIADNKGKEDEHVAPFQGFIPWADVVRALHDINYQNDFAFEIHHLTSAFPLSIQADMVHFSHTLGEYLLSDRLFEDAEMLKTMTAQ